MSVDERSAERRKEIAIRTTKAGVMALALTVGGIAFESNDDGWNFSLQCSPSANVVEGPKEERQLPDQPESPETVIRGESNE